MALVRLELWREPLVLRHTGVTTVMKLSSLRPVAIVVMAMVVTTVVRWLLLLCRLVIFLRGSVL